MRYLLTAHGKAELARLRDARALLAFDFDGTLAPLTPLRDQAKMRARTRRLLDRLGRRFPCAVISGRSRKDTAARLTGLPVKYVVGNHGLEPGGDLRACADVAARATAAMAAQLARWPGVELEDKRYSFALHTRNARGGARLHAQLQAAVEALPWPMRIVHGKRVVNAVPAQAPHKGDALVTLMAKARADLAFYIGDDVTDEDVFELDRPDQVITVRVGASRASAASYYLRDQPEIDALLSLLAALRRSRAKP